MVSRTATVAVYYQLGRPQNSSVDLPQAECGRIIVERALERADRATTEVVSGHVLDAQFRGLVATKDRELQDRAGRGARLRKQVPVGAGDPLRLHDGDVGKAGESGRHEVLRVGAGSDLEQRGRDLVLGPRALTDRDDDVVATVDLYEAAVDLALRKLVDRTDQSVVRQRAVDRDGLAIRNGTTGELRSALCGTTDEGRVHGVVLGVQGDTQHLIREGLDEAEHIVDERLEREVGLETALLDASSLRLLTAHVSVGVRACLGHDRNDTVRV